MSAPEYPELRGKTVSAEALMAYVYENHQHLNLDGEGNPVVVMSVPLEAWLREQSAVSAAGHVDVVERVLDAPTSKEVLHNTGSATVREYFACLLHELLLNGEEFDSKRPFGYSDWQNDLELALVNASLVSGTVDSDGALVTVDSSAVADLLHSAIGRMGGETPAERDET